jgi:hypothetical protein
MPMWLPMPGSRQRQGTRKMPFERENYQFVTHNKKLICDHHIHLQVKYLVAGLM